MTEWRESLSMLMDLYPPLPSIPNVVVDWTGLQSAVGFEFPDSFKEYVAVYGNSSWCDHIGVFTPPDVQKTSVKNYLSRITEHLSLYGYKFRDENRKRISIKKFPEGKELYPVFSDSFGDIYLWDTSVEDPERRPVYHCATGCFRVLPRIMSVPEMIYEWMTDEKIMKDFWCDISELPPEKKRIFE